MMTVDAVVPASERPPWRAVAVPSEHGGWGLTLEPVLLGLLIAPSIGGLALGAAAFLAFLVRTPMKLAVVDLRRGRWLDRSRLAMRIALVELAAMAMLVSVAFFTSGRSWLVAVAVAAPLVGLELWFDVRSRGRRLVPELCGAVGIAAVAAAIVLAAGRGGALATGVWLVLAARSIGAISFVRVQITRLRRGAGNSMPSDAAQVVAIAIGAVAVGVDSRLLAALAGIAVLAVLQVWWIRRPPLPAKVLGMRQMLLGVGLVAVTAVGVLGR